MIKFDKKEVKECLMEAFYNGWSEGKFTYSAIEQGYGFKVETFVNYKMQMTTYKDYQVADVGIINSVIDAEKRIDEILK